MRERGRKRVSLWIVRKIASNIVSLYINRQSPHNLFSHSSQKVRVRCCRAEYGARVTKLACRLQRPLAKLVLLISQMVLGSTCFLSDSKRCTDTPLSPFVNLICAWCLRREFTPAARNAGWGQILTILCHDYDWYMNGEAAPSRLRPSP